MDEFEVWQENEKEGYYGQGGNESLRKKSELLNGHFSKISKQFSDLDSMELGAISSFIDQIQDCLD